MRSRVTRRDFLQGVAIGGAGLALGGTPGQVLASSSAAPAPAPYPPALTGLRGSHPGAFEVAHSLREGTFWKTAGKVVPTGEEYDLVVVGGGISGLSAAWFYRRRLGPRARILILENHDDVGGHARRNEFRRGSGGLVLGYGGSYAVESAEPLGKVPRALIEELGVDLARGEKTTDRGFYASRGLGRAIFFDRETFGADKVVPDPMGDPGGEANDEVPAGWDPWPRFLSDAPLAGPVLEEFRRLCQAPADPLPGRSPAERREHLSRISYARFLSEAFHSDPLILKLLQTRTLPLYGVGIDAVAALDAYGACMPGFSGMSLDEPGEKKRVAGTECHAFEGGSEYFHFPDGNASFVRLLVRGLVPGSLPPGAPEAILPIPLDYGRLDREGQPVRIRLSSTVVKVEHRGDPADAEGVEVSYVQGGGLASVRARHAVLACWNGVIPHLCPSLPKEQKEALAYGVKIPLVYASVLVSRWSAFDGLGAFTLYAPGGYFTTLDLGRAVRMESYRAATDADQPMVLHMVKVPCFPGLPARQQHRTGRVELLSTSFADYEGHVREQLGRILGPFGFDPDREIEAITVNRWPHGYTYEYSSLWDREALEAAEPPCVRGRKRFGRIAIANADAGAYSYMDGAMEQAHRAVSELLDRPRPKGTG